MPSLHESGIIIIKSQELLCLDHNLFKLLLGFMQCE